jgi:hypothetical protein
MNHFHRSSNNNSNNGNYNDPVIESKPPRTTRSSIDTRNSISNVQSLNDSTSHRRTSYVKSHSSPSPSHRQNFNSSSTNSEFFNQNSHRVHQKAPKESNYLPQKRNDSALSNHNRSNTRQSNKFLDSSGSESEDVKKINKPFEKKTLIKNGVNNFLVSEETSESIKSFFKCVFTVDGKSADCELDEHKISWKYISSCKNYINFSSLSLFQG